MRMTAIGANLAAGVGLLAVAACAAVPQSPPSNPSASASGAATVLAVRPIMATGAGEDSAWRSVLLDGTAQPQNPAQAQGPTQAQGPALAEFIVREDAGATLSIVQSNAAALHPGDRVVITHPASSAGRASLIRLL